MPKIGQQKVVVKEPTVSRDEGSDAGCWKYQKITVQTDEGAKRVDARVYGGLAVHPCTSRGQPGKWSLTHLKSGLAVVPTLASDLDAIKIGSLLWSRHCLAFREADPLQVKAKLPQEAVDWIKRCREAQRCLEP